MMLKISKRKEVLRSNTNIRYVWWYHASFVIQNRKVGRTFVGKIFTLHISCQSQPTRFVQFNYSNACFRSFAEIMRRTHVCWRKIRLGIFAKTPNTESKDVSWINSTIDKNIMNGCLTVVVLTQLVNQLLKDYILSRRFVW